MLKSLILVNVATMSNTVKNPTKDNIPMSLSGEYCGVFCFFC